MADLNWNLLARQPDFANIASDAFAAGQERAKKQKVRNVLAAYGKGDKGEAFNALVRDGHLTEAASLASVDSAFGKIRARDAATSTFGQGGSYAEAAEAARAHDFETAASLDDLANTRETRVHERLKREREVGQFAGSILMSASQLASPQERRAFILQHRDRLTQYGLPAEKVDGYDVTDPRRMRADAAAFMELGKVAGETSVEKMGDYAVTYQTDPVNGTRAVGKAAIPPTRAEIRAERKDAADAEYRSATLSLRERELADRDAADTPSKVVGRIYGKLERGETLTAGEQSVLEHYSMRKQDPILAAQGVYDDLGGEDEDDAFASPPARPAAPPARAAATGSSRAPAAAAPAPRNATERRTGAVYSTPRGPMKWTGTGWVQP